MKNRKVLNVRTHIGGVNGKLTYDHLKDKAVMEMVPPGVIVQHAGRTILVPWTNVVEVVLGDETEDEKRGPGRPPGPRAA